jgi:hypothetical protein
VLIALVDVAARGIGLPDLDELVADRSAIAVDDPSGHHHPFTDRLAAVLNGQVGLQRMHVAAAKTRRPQLDRLGIGVVQDVGWMAQQAAAIGRIVQPRLGLGDAAALVLGFGRRDLGAHLGLARCRHGMYGHRGGQPFTSVLGDCEGFAPSLSVGTSLVSRAVRADSTAIKHDGLEGRQATDGEGGEPHQVGQPVDGGAPTWVAEFENGRGRFGLDPTFVDDLRELDVLYDRDSSGEFLHFYTRTVGAVFFEFVQRRGDYDDYGTDNAPVRLAAQRHGTGRRQRRSSVSGG